MKTFGQFMAEGKFNLHAARRRARLKREKEGSYADDPYYQGDAAAHAGKKLEDNPHTHGTQDHEDWAQGHREAEGVKR